MNSCYILKIPELESKVCADPIPPDATHHFRPFGAIYRRARDLRYDCCVKYQNLILEHEIKADSRID